MVKLLAKTTDLNSVPEAFRGAYSKDPVNNVYVLSGDVEFPDAPVEPPPKDDARLKEFRDNNLALKRQLDEMQAKLGSIDTEKYKAAMAAFDKLQNTEERDLISKGDLTGLRAKWFEQEKLEREKMERNSTAKTAEVQARAETYLKKLRERTTKQAISDALSDAKVQLANSSAARDAASRANEVFSLNDQGDLVALEPDGTQMFNKDNKPLTPKDFVQRLIDEAPHLFSAGSGGGAPGSGGGGGGSRRPGVVQLSRTDAKGFGQLASKIADGTVTVEYID